MTREQDLPIVCEFTPPKSWQAKYGRQARLALGHGILAQGRQIAIAAEDDTIRAQRFEEDDPALSENDSK
jgi:hypothetical protein